MNRATCQICHGASLKPEILAMTLCSRFPVGSAAADPEVQSRAESPTGRLLQAEGSELNIHQVCEFTIAEVAASVRQLQRLARLRQRTACRNEDRSGFALTERKTSR